MEHRCRRGSYCPDFEVVDGKRLGRQIVTAEGLCDTCGRHVDRALRELPADYVGLHTILGHGRTVGGEPVRMTRDLPVPIRLHIEALQTEMVREATTWAASVARVCNMDWAPDGGCRPGWLLDRACRLLSSSPSVLLALRDEKHELWEYGQLVTVSRDGIDGALSFLRLHQKARIFAGNTRLVHRLPVPCPRCESMSLEREDGQDTIDCTACDRRYTWEEYEKLCLIVADRKMAVR